MLAFSGICIFSSDSYCLICTLDMWARACIYAPTRVHVCVHMLSARVSAGLCWDLGLRTAIHVTYSYTCLSSRKSALFSGDRCCLICTLAVNTVESRRFPPHVCMLVPGVRETVHAERQSQCARKEPLWCAWSVKDFIICAETLYTSKTPYKTARFNPKSALSLTLIARLFALKRGTQGNTSSSRCLIRSHLVVFRWGSACVLHRLC